MPVPDGLEGQRVDAGLAKLLGFSRTFAAEVAEAGGVVLDGHTLGKSDRLSAGGWLDVSWQPRREATIVPIAVPDLGIVYDDDDIVVVDKPAGVAAHPSLGWEGPTVVGALAAAGYRIATTGAAGPTEQDGHPVGLVYVAVSDARGDEVREHRFVGERAQIRNAAVMAALELAAERLELR